MSSAAAVNPAGEGATEKQLKYARDLGLEVKDEDPGWQVSRAIKAELRRRAREVMRTLRPIVGDILWHPIHGNVRVVRLSKETMKVTLQELPGGRKFVNDVAWLGDCIRLRSDDQLNAFVHALPSVVQWCRMYKVEPLPNNWQWSAGAWELARRAAGPPTSGS